LYTQHWRSSPLPPHLPTPPNLVHNSIPIETTSRATLLAKADGVLAGQALANQILAAVDPDLMVAWSKVDGDSIAKGEVFMEVEGSAHSILRAERVLLNFMQAWPGHWVVVTRSVTLHRRVKVSVIYYGNTLPVCLSPS